MEHGNIFDESDGIAATNSNEALPPYSLLDMSGLEIVEEEDMALAVENGPTELKLTRDNSTGNLTKARQLLSSNGCFILNINLEGFASTRMVVRMDKTDHYKGLLYMVARIRYSKDSTIAVSATSAATEGKSSQRTINLAADDQSPSVLANDQSISHCHLELVLPRPTEQGMTKLKELVVRLPSKSQLRVSGIESGTVGRIHAALISGMSVLDNVHVDGLRMAIGDGSISANHLCVAKVPAEFISMRGQINIDRCQCRSIRVKSPEASIELEDIKANTLTILAENGQVDVRSAVIANNISCQTTSGPVTLERVKAETIVVATESSSVRGSWDVSKILDISATASIVQGQLIMTGSNADANIRTRQWPVRLTLSENFAGRYDITANNSIVTLPSEICKGTIYEAHTSCGRQGVVGNSHHTLKVENTNAPVAISTMPSPPSPPSPSSASAHQ